MAALIEQYRPRRWEDVVGQRVAVERIQRAIARSWGGRAWWIVGVSGCGKTTIARIIANEGADDFAIVEWDSQWLTPTRIRQEREHWRCRVLGEKSGRCYIVNEAHAMSTEAVTELLTALDPVPEHVCFVFTTTLRGQQLFEEQAVDAKPLMQRCTKIVLENGEQTRQDFARRAKAIAMAEGIDGLPDEAYRASLDACGGSMRALLGQIESGAFADDYADAQKQASDKAARLAALQTEYDAVRYKKDPDSVKRRETLLKMIQSMPA